MGQIKYPIGIQSFSEIRNNGYLYVDKTEYIHQLVATGKYYFLSRPRRFGKSLMISTLEALFKGKHELFKGLAIDSLEWDWKSYEVLHLDLNAQNYKDEDSLYASLDWQLNKWESYYGIASPNHRLENRFADVILRAYEISGKGAVILVDEYDKPLLANIDNQERQDKFRNILQAFFSVLKSLDSYIKFGMLTGVSRFSKVSVFSSLNNLQDISLVRQYNSICGITESELSVYFEESIKKMAKALDKNVSDIYAELKSNYDGYHFSSRGEDIYNPFSLLSAFKNQEFGSYWLSTGTTSSLLDVLNVNSYPLQDLESCRCTENMLNGADIFLSDPIPFFFQSGYLTIKSYDQEFKEYTLGFPNREVAQGFNDLILKTWMRSNEPSAFISEFVRDVRCGNAEKFMEKIQSFFPGIPYDYAKASSLNDADDNSAEIKGDKEVHYQNVMYVIVKLMGFYTHTEFRTSNGRIDMLIDTPHYIYVMEFKINSSAKEALDQIEEREYTLPFRNSAKKIIKIGASFDTATRRLSDWMIENG